LELLELVDDLDRDQVGPRGEDLPELDERGAELGEDEPDPGGRRGAARAGVGLGLAGHERSEAGALDDLPEAVPDEDLDDLPEPAEIADRVEDRGHGPPGYPAERARLLAATGSSGRRGRCGSWR